MSSASSSSAMSLRSARSATSPTLRVSRSAATDATPTATSRPTSTRTSTRHGPWPSPVSLIRVVASRVAFGGGPADLDPHLGAVPITPELDGRLPGSLVGLDVPAIVVELDIAHEPAVSSEHRTVMASDPVEARRRAVPQLERREVAVAARPPLVETG